MTLAHAGHWYHSILYLVPVLLIAAALWWSGREGRQDAGADGAQDRAAYDDDLLALPADEAAGAGGDAPVAGAHADEAHADEAGGDGGALR